MKYSSVTPFAVLAFLLLLSCQDSLQSNASEGDILWAKTYGGTQEDFAYSVLETIDGHLAVFGYTGSIDGDITDKVIEENDYWLMKLDLEGNILWSKTYGGSGDDVGQKFIQTTDGGFALAGYSMSSDGDASNNEGFHDNWLVKLDSQGNFQWEKSYGFAGHDHAYSIIQTSDGGYFMTGFLDVTASNGDGNNRSFNVLHGVGEFWCHKLDASGNIEWRRYFGGTNNDRSYDVVQSNDGGFVITGFTESNDFDVSSNNGAYDYWVIKLDPLGNLLWEHALGGTEIDQSRGIVKTNDNAYLIIGNSFSSDGDISSNYGSSDFWVVKVDDLGNIVWQKNYGGSNFDYATSINSTSEGFVIAGYSQSLDHDLSNNHGENDFWLIHIDQNGNLLFEKNIGGSGIDLAYDVIETSQGNIIIIGDTESADIDVLENKGMKDVLIVKIQ